MTFHDPMFATIYALSLSFRVEPRSSLPELNHEVRQKMDVVHSRAD